MKHIYWNSNTKINDADIDRLAEIYLKLKGSIFLRLINKDIYSQCGGRLSEHISLIKSIPDPNNDDNWIIESFDKVKELTFGEFLKAKGINI